MLLLFYRLWWHFSSRRQFQLCMLLVLSITSSLFEMLSIGVVLPFLAVLATPEEVMKSSVMKPILFFFPEITSTELVILLTIAFVVTIILSGIFRILNLWAGLRFAYSTGADLSANIYRRTLYQPYAVHVSRNSSQIIDGVANKTSIVIHTINAVLVLISTAILLSFILGGLLIINPLITVITFGVLVLLYGVIVFVVRRQLMKNGEVISINSIKVFKALQEGLGGIRDILLDGTQEIYCAIFKSADFPLRRAQERNQFIGQLPKYILEMIGMLILIGVGFYISERSGGVIYAIPLIGLLAIGTQRLLPTFQQAFQAWSIIKSNQFILQDVLLLLEQKLPARTEFISEILFSDEINLRNVSFTYNESEGFALKNINLKIPRGARVGFVGKTGSGKSTLIDLIMGFLSPSSGELLIDNISVTESNVYGWQKHIAHVPQSIYLADASIEENIAFGIFREDISHERVVAAAQMAQISGDIDQWPIKYKTAVGERGVQLSGGQRQRIGIARAFYKGSDVIVLDEATSALDSETEKRVMESLKKLSHNITVILVAHRISTLKECNLIYELNSGKIEWSGSYYEYLERSNRDN